MKPLQAFVILQSLLLTTVLAVPPKPEYLQFFDPAKGFKPAQRNLTDIYLQIAASLECYGSPEPYLRHMQAEHERIAKRVSAKVGHPVQSSCPAQMTGENIDKLVANWNQLAPVLHLDELAKTIGADAREGIRGTRDTGTVLVEIFNEHQKRILSDMAAAKSRTVGFDDLKTKVTVQMEMNKPQVDLVGYKTERRDAVGYASIIKSRLTELNTKLASALPREKANDLGTAITGVFLALSEMGHSELEAAIQEWSVQ